MIETRAPGRQGTTLAFPVGSLISARGREWVVLPGSDEELLRVRPVAGNEDEETGIVLAVEGPDVVPARFDLPGPDDVGDFRASRLLREAVRIGFRSSAGPFRSFGRIAVEPRPYQLVPLLMALKLDPVRLLIADDVGIGKTIEALLIARELLDQGTVRRLAVLCPPQLAEQWQREMKEKFHLDAELVLPGTAARLERNLMHAGESLFDHFPFTIVSTDYIKSDRRREDFLNFAPECVIVDEAHTCVTAGGPANRGRTQRHELLKGLSRDPDRHLLLVTATPHSGKHEAFVALLGLLNEAFYSYPLDLTGPANRPLREELARFFVQRRRPDIEQYLGENTRFPERLRTEETYTLSPEYRKLFDRAVRFARDAARDDSGGRHRQRVRWWSALALLRSLASSPAAAAATLRNRARVAEAATADEADQIGRQTVLDHLVEEESAEDIDVPPGSDFTEQEENDSRRRTLLELARAAEKITPRQDAKLQRAVTMVRALLEDGKNPILFCRYIPTAEYVADQLRSVLPAEVAVAAVTGSLPPAEREQRIVDLGDQSDSRVLVATDCLSEGVNLQRYFSAVIHYDLSWNPTRHEQREGRVDRFNQPQPVVRAVTYYGEDNRIDHGVMRVLLRKHDQIRAQTGVAVPVPDDTSSVVESLSWQILLSEDYGRQLTLDELVPPEQRELFDQWERAADLEKRSRSLFAQQTIKPEAVAREVDAARSAIGSPVIIRDFALAAITTLGGTWQQLGDRYRIDLTGVPVELRERIGNRIHFDARFDLPVDGHEEHLTRTHPVVDALANHILDSAMEALTPGVAARAGVIRTAAVSRRHSLLLVRYRFDIIERGTEERTLLAEDCRVLAFAGSFSEPEWLPGDQAEQLLDARPDANVTREQAVAQIDGIRSTWTTVEGAIQDVGRQLASDLATQHERVRDAAKRRGVRFQVRPHDPADVLGIYVLLPAEVN